MALTANQDIPKKQEVKESWTVRSLFPFSGIAKSLTKSFHNPFDVLLGYLVLILGISELIGRDISLFFWILTISILVADIFERRSGILTNSKEVNNKKDKK